MNRVLAKYGLAAHLAFLAVAPLFLSPFCSDAATAKSLLWLALLATPWCFLAPSVRAGETTHAARARVTAGAVRDPLFWTSLALLAVAGVRALNGGVRMAYDAETSAWRLAQPAWELFPGCADGVGFLPFAVATALAVVLLGARHALGRSARLAFLLLAASGSGLAAVVVLLAAHEGHAACAALLSTTDNAFSFYGFAEGIYLLGGIAAFATAFERGWTRAMPLFALAVGGTALGAFLFAPPAFALLFGVLALVALAGVFAYLFRVVGKSSEFRCLAVCAIALALGGLTVAFAAPADAVSARLDAFAEGSFVPDGLLALRGTLSELALRAWKETPWTGTGLGTFGLDVRFQAQPADWAALPRGIAAIPNGGWLLLTERGLVGAVCLALPFGLLVFSFGRRVAAWATSRPLAVPHPGVLLLPLVAVAIAATVPFDASFLRADALLAAVSAAAVAPRCFPNVTEEKKAR